MINHYNLFRSAEIDGAAAPGYSSGQGLKAMEELAKQNMMQGMSFEWTGLALEEIEAGGKAISFLGWDCWWCTSRCLRSMRASRCPSSFCWRCRWRCWVRLVLYLHAWPVERCLLPDRTGDADRIVGEELDSDRRVRRAIARARDGRSRKRQLKLPNCACGQS